MCRKNFILLLIYISVSIFAGMFLADYIINLLELFELLPIVILNIVCVVIFGLFLLPFLDRFVE
jgi:hypothetical protein